MSDERETVIEINNIETLLLGLLIGFVIGALFIALTKIQIPYNYYFDNMTYDYCQMYYNMTRVIP
jgi:hypothetical protein